MDSRQNLGGRSALNHQNPSLPSPDLIRGLTRPSTSYTRERASVFKSEKSSSPASPLSMPSRHASFSYFSFSASIWSRCSRRRSASRTETGGAQHDRTCHSSYGKASLIISGRQGFIAGGDALPRALDRPRRSAKNAVIGRMRGSMKVDAEDGFVDSSKRHGPPAVMAGLDPAIYVFGLPRSASRYRPGKPLLLSELSP